MRLTLLKYLTATFFICLSTSLALAQKPPDPKSAPAPTNAASPPAHQTLPLAETLTGGAKEDYDAGRLLYGDGDFAGALVKFMAAYDQAKDPRLLWNMAACQKNLRHYAKVVGLVDRFLAEGGDLINEQDRSDAKDLREAIESFTALLTIQSNEAGAEVLIDDEPVGITPLEKPCLVDLGMRRITLKKHGFRSASVEVPVGGSRELTKLVKLEPEVHAGKLSVRSVAGATISLNGKRVGVGTFSGVVPSGGHTLSVVAPGMRPYQTEVVIADDEQRSVEVALEPIPKAVPAQEEHGALYGMELGVRSGYGRDFRHDNQHPKTLPLWLDIGYRLGVPTLLGIYGQFGWIDRSASCGISGRHGPVPLYPTDDSVRYAYEKCTFIKTGVELLFHTLPRTLIDPWFGFDAGIHASFTRYRSYDPLTGQYATGKDNNASIQPGFQVGVDTHPWQAAGFGLFLHTGPEFGSEGQRHEGDQTSSNPCGQPGQPACSSNNGCSGGSCDNQDNGPTFHWIVGARAAYTFP